MSRVDVIIPVYKPTGKLLILLAMLRKQTEPIGQIILINTEKECFDNFTSEEALQEAYGPILVKHISKEEFDHGKTRNMGVGFSQSSFFVMMTDDAVPENDKLIEELLAPFDEEKTVMSYARQLPAPGCGVIESYTREFNYPPQSGRKTAENLKDLGIKAFFASNVCAAYRREVFEKLGGFTDHTIFNEDMIFARGVLNAGYQIAYAADAKVCHSHNYSGLQQFRRNFDLGVSHAEYPEIFAGLPTESEGIRLVKKTCAYLCKIGKPWLIIKLVWQSGWKYLGYFLGKRYRKLPESWVKSWSMNKNYW